jgi:replicative DNA helicase
MKSLRQVSQSIRTAKDKHECFALGFPRLDDFLDGGFYKKELIVIGAHTGVGKSLVAGQILLNVARQGYKTAFFSLEISSEMVLSRLVGSICNIKPSRIMYGMLTKQELELYKQAEAQVLTLDDLITFYDDKYELKEILDEINKNDYEFVVIDFIQNIIDSTQDEYARLSNASLMLQQSAKINNACITVLSQLSNSSAKEGINSKIVQYKGSGAIAMVCDLGFYLDRESTQAGDDTQNEVKFVLMKNRRGPSGRHANLIYQSPGGHLREK